jgi:tRNA threonylcarbamoyladenosine biosynthesis protein TsaE
MNSKIVRTISDPAKLDELAKELINFAGTKNIWAFYGEMGAGKTTFIRQICALLGVKENVTSPTFSLINEYRDRNNNPVFHFDFYRIEKQQEAIDIGCEEYFERNALCLIEWPEKILNLLPHPLVKITIEVERKNRKFTFSYD